MKALSEYSVTELQRAVALKEQIEALERQIEELTGESAEAAPVEAPVRAKRKLSPAHRRKLMAALAKARKARWANAKSAAEEAPVRKKRRRLSAASRAALSAAAKARWAKFRAEKAG